MIRAVIVEDEPLASRYLEALLEKTGRVDVVGTARNAEWAVSVCGDQSPEAAFVDVRLPGRDGIELAAELSRLPKPPLLVFTTGHTDRACQAFRLDAVDYLLKPIEYQQVCAAVSRVEQRLGHESQFVPGAPRTDRLPVKCLQDDIIKLIPKLEIVAVVHRDRHTWISTATHEYATNFTLSELESWLGGAPFLRIARESIVNVGAITEVVHYGDRLYQVVLRDRIGSRLCASRSGAAAIAAMLRMPRN